MMGYTYARQKFSLLTDTGGAAAAGDTGPPFWGQVVQMRAVPADTGVADTGLTLEVGIYPEAGDTGSGFLIHNGDMNGAGAITRVPKLPVHSLDGSADTGWAYPVGAGDKLRVKARAGRTLDATSPVNVFVWTKG